jgi:hypothetical protein
VKRAVLDECALSVRALTKVAKLVDVDEIIASNEEMKIEMIEEIAELLETARYDVNAYADWVASNP